MMMPSDWTLSYNTILIGTLMGITAPPISFLRGVRPYISNLIERILNLICTVMCIKVLNILFFNMLLYKQNAIIEKKDYLFKFEAAIFITRTKGVIYTRVK